MLSQTTYGHEGGSFAALPHNIQPRCGVELSCRLAAPAVVNSLVERISVANILR